MKVSETFAGRLAIACASIPVLMVRGIIRLAMELVCIGAIMVVVLCFCLAGAFVAWWLFGKYLGLLPSIITFVVLYLGFAAGANSTVRRKTERGTSMRKDVKS